jgi:hypothetical protein
MSITMPADKWLSELRKEYLQNFIPSGGAAVKFVVPVDGLEHQGLLDKLKQGAEEDGYLFVSVDAATTKLHMIDQVFHAVAKQVAWDDLAYTFLCATLKHQYRLPENRKDFGLEQLAALNSLDLWEMQRIIDNRLRDRPFKDYAMTDAFRRAMRMLCQAQLAPQDVGAGIAEAIKEWLRGELHLISSLKSSLIFQKIGRNNGRYMLCSLSHWLNLTGKAGLVIVLDISRFLEAKRPQEPDGTLYYTTTTVVDGYEVLRQCIDGTDELEFCLIVVVAPPSFLSDERRGLRAYDALRLRIWDDVHDRQQPNPLSSLVRLSGEEPTVNLPGPGGPP